MQKACRNCDRLFLILTLKAEVAGALKGESTDVALHEQTEFIMGNAQLHAVAALHLKGDMIGVRMAVFVMVSV